MNLLLIAFLAIALIITAIGFALSPRTEERDSESERLAYRDVARQPRPRAGSQRRPSPEIPQKTRASRKKALPGARPSTYSEPRTVTLPGSRTRMLPESKRTSALSAPRSSGQSTQRAAGRSAPRAASVPAPHTSILPESRRTAGLSTQRAAMRRYDESNSYMPVGARAYRPVQPSYVATSVIELQDETLLDQIFAHINRLFEHRHEEPVPWAVAVVGLVSIVILGLALLTNILPHQPLAGYVPFVTNADTGSSGSTSTTPSKPGPPPAKYDVSKSLVRLGQLDSNQYSSPAEYSTWAYSACSSASMAEVFNAYGRHYRVTDVLSVESAIHEITPDLGLLEDIGVARTAAKFGFKTTWGDGNFSLDKVIGAANSGTPVIVSFPPNRYPDGHILVVVGGNSSTVFTADSSYYNHKAFSRAQFLKYWGGFYAIATPK